MTPEAVIFDCDGTLVDSEGLQAEVFAELLAGHGWKQEPAEILVAFRGRRLATCIAELEARFGALRHDFEAAFRARSAELLRTRLCEIEGAAALLGALPHPACVASNAPRAKIELCLEMTGLARFFAGRVFSAYEVGAWKPAPDLFLHAAAAMGTPAARCLVVEDSAAGVEAARAAGMKVVALLHEPAPAWLPEGVPAIRALSELRGILSLP
ncbi:HAD-IA family hydrolase [Falsiroseomonas sp.]|uniref:HAD-IA family hydrolase n=1 Tax=Falsiroseomonas sp. TaxID=2870721 RepID=UPI0035612F0C